MDPTVLLILLKQGERSLEDHTRDYIFLAEHSHFPDSSLCTFYRAGLNTTTKGLLSGEGPRESLPDYIEWVLASCGSSWTIDFVKEDVSPTQDPEPSQPSPRHVEYEPEPTADEEPEPRATEPEPDTSDQVREPATTFMTVECCVEQERAMESPAQCTTAGAPLLTLSPPPVKWARRGSASFHRRHGWRIPQLRLQPQSPELRLGPPTLRLHHGSQLPRLHRRPTSSTGLPRPSGSALVGCRPAIALGLHSSGFASSLHPTGSVGLLPSSGSPSVLCRSGSAADLRSSASASVARALGSALALRILGVALDLWLSVSTSGSTSTCSAVGRPPGVVSPSSTMAPPSVGSTVGLHHGCGLGLYWLLLLRVPPVSSLAPPTFVAPLDSVDS
ncbi:hypothetical protein M9458_013170, partial [Cirrhinus mrigala]